ncbi:hypothetical protein BXZ70DRAFT_97120 [Cristinia sonorae]|uniref:Uncharacterized protein n=1 Tax=Cristinia sonorae TaxID=1940300 RepID=A0A8K0UR24_9AGAR|nr:hypothetical protein BXZ70DRAFT_97120 [Cristinia sonorae]
MRQQVHQFQMSHKTFTIQSTGEDTAKVLTTNVTIAFTIVPDRPHAKAIECPPVAWKVLQFFVDVSEVKQLRLNSSRRVGVAGIQNEGTSRWIMMTDNGAGLGPNQHLSVSRSGKWTTNVLFDSSTDASFITNNSSSVLTLSVGSRSSSNAFEPMGLLPSLQ